MKISRELRIELNEGIGINLSEEEVETLYNELRAYFGDAYAITYPMSTSIGNNTVAFPQPKNNNTK